MESSEFTGEPFFSEEEVEKRSGRCLAIRLRLGTLLHERGKKWADIYNELGWHKSFASKVFNGLFIPPLWQRVALAKALNTDSTVIWGEVKNE